MYTRRNTNRCPARMCCDNAGTMVAAGYAESRPCDEWGMSGSVPLATAYFQDQDYREGFCPCEALNSGTLFPELMM